MKERIPEAISNIAMAFFWVSVIDDMSPVTPFVVLLRVGVLGLGANVS